MLQALRRLRVHEAAGAPPPALAGAHRGLLISGWGREMARVRVYAEGERAVQDDGRQLGGSGVVRRTAVGRECAWGSGGSRDLLLVED